MPEPDTRDDHLAWCRQRALDLVEAGDWKQGLTSMFSDLRKHPETYDHPGIALGEMQLWAGQLSGPADARTYIEGFS